MTKGAKMETDKIYLGDAYELIKEIPDKSIDLIVTDPPYKIEGIDGRKSGILKKQQHSYVEEIKTIVSGINLGILPELVRVMKKINIYIWCNKEQIYDYLTFFVKERKCRWEMIVWAKNNPAPFLNGHYLKDKEYCLFFWEKGVKVSPTWKTGNTVYSTNANVEDKKLYRHPTIKPLKIVENLIQNSSTGGGKIVFDPFCGSGTTCMAAKELGRKYLGFEINEKWHKVAVDRLNGITANGQTSIFTDFDELEKIDGQPR